MRHAVLDTVFATAENILTHLEEADTPSGFDRADLCAHARTAREKMAADRSRTDVLFQGQRDGHDYARLFNEWRAQPPSMAALLATAAEELRISPTEPALLAAALATSAADVSSANAYHDTNHFREVTAMMAVYCKVHQDMAAKGENGVIALTGADMAKCLLAAIAHDLGHDGRGNTVDGQHTPYRLESQAIAAIEPLMAAACMSDKDCEDVRTLIRVTDVSAPKGEASPHKILRKLVKGEPANLPLELIELALDPKLRQMAALMSDADLAPSAATNYITSAKQLRRLSEENPALAATDANLSGFLKFVVEGEFISPAAKQHSQESLTQLQNKTVARVAAATPPQANP